MSRTQMALFCLMIMMLPAAFASIHGLGTVDIDTNLHVQGDALVTGNLRIGDAYTLMKTDGINGQVLTTNGAGVVAWQSVQAMTLSVPLDGITNSQTICLPAISGGNLYYFLEVRWLVTSLTGTFSNHPSISMGTTAGGTDIMASQTLATQVPAVYTMSSSFVVSVGANQFSLSAGPVYVNITIVAPGGTVYTGKIWMLYCVMSP